MSFATLHRNARYCLSAPATHNKSTSRLPRVYVAILGARGHYAVPKLLFQAGILGRFFTDLYAGTVPWLMRLVEMLPPAWRPQIAGRFLGRFESGLPRTMVASFPTLGAWYFWRRQRARDTLALERVHVTAARRFNNRIIRHGLAGADVVYGCNGASLELFERARDDGVKCVLEQTSPPQAVRNLLLKRETERWIEWQPGLQIDRNDRLIEREWREWQLADLIVAGSDFVVNALQQCGVAENKCRVVPYGVCLDRFTPARSGGTSRILRLLFAGEVGLTKGVPYLLEALRLLDSPLVEARLAGRVALDNSRLRPYRQLATLLGAVPRREMPSLFQWADVLVLPSVCEGSALVGYEALASGVPVIATPNAGSPVRDGIDGVLIPIGDAEALASAFERFLKDRDFLRSCSRNAVENRNHLGLDAYGRRLMRAIRKTVSTQPQ